MEARDARDDARVSFKTKEKEKEKEKDASACGSFVGSRGELLDLLSLVLEV